MLEVISAKMMCPKDLKCNIIYPIPTEIVLVTHLKIEKYIVCQLYFSKKEKKFNK